MQKDQIEKIISKYRNLAASSCDDEQIYRYERFADYIEDNIEIFEDDEDCETVEHLMESFNEAEAEIDAQRDAMFPEGDDDDSITDYLTR